MSSGRILLTFTYSDFYHFNRLSLNICKSVSFGCSFATKTCSVCSLTALLYKRCSSSPRWVLSTQVPSHNTVQGAYGWLLHIWQFVRLQTPSCCLLPSLEKVNLVCRAVLSLITILFNKDRVGNIVSHAAHQRTNYYSCISQ